MDKCGLCWLICKKTYLKLLYARSHGKLAMFRISSILLPIARRALAVLIRNSLKSVMENVNVLSDPELSLAVMDCAVVKPGDEPM